MTPLRKKMQPERARKCVYTLQNYPLLDMKQQSGDGYEDFLDGILTADDLAAAQAKEHRVLRRGTRIINNAPAARDSDESEEDENPPETIRWAVPSGFLVAAQPAKIDRDCVDRFVLLKWKDYGWSLGKVTEPITSKSPRLLKKYSVKVMWAVKGRLHRKCSGPCNLDLACYASGPDAPLDSWVFLDKAQSAAQRS